MGLAFCHHERSIIFRREYPQLRELIEKSRKLAGPIGQYNGQEHIWRMNDGRTIEFGAVQYEHSVEKFQGRAHSLKCVGAGTLVWMANGTRKQIEEIAVGEYVMTLEGAKRVTHTMRQKKSAVRLNLFHQGKLLYSQVQSASHRVLTRIFGQAQWLSADQLGLYRTCASLTAIESREFCKCAELSLLTHQTPPQFQQGKLNDPQPLPLPFAHCSGIPSTHPNQSKRVFAVENACGQPYSFAAIQSRSVHRYGQWLKLKFSTIDLVALARSKYLRQPLLSRLDMEKHQCGQGEFFETVHTNQGIDFLGFGDSPQAPQPQALPLDAFLVAPQLHRDRGVLPCVMPTLSRDDCDAPFGSSPANFPPHYWCDFRQYDEQPHGDLGIYLVSPFRQSVGADAYTPTCLPVDEMDRTHRHSRCRLWYSHPYTKEMRQSILEAYACPHFSIDILDSSCVSDSGEIRDKTQSLTQLYDLTVDGANHYITGIGLVNKNCFDEVTHFTELQYRTLSGWARTENPDERVRVVATGNPPASYQGQWVREYWGPWLDPNHPKPAAPGELVWYVEIAGKSLEIARGDDRPPPYIHEGEELTARSRTFIPARVDDNPYYMATGYKAVLQSMPEPLRSQLLFGDFSAGGTDDPWQIFPSAWVDAAIERWTEEPPEGTWQNAVGCDPARGGADNSAIAERWGDWFQVHTLPGSQTKTGPEFVQFLLTVHRGVAHIGMDVIGIGSSPIDTLEQMGIPATALSGAEGSTATDRTGKLAFKNKRSEWIWKFREALDPDYGSKIALPNNPRMKAGLLAMRWSLSTWKIVVEPKEDIKKRLGFSPDEAEAIIYAAIEGGGELEAWFGFTSGAGPS